MIMYIHTNIGISLRIDEHALMRAAVVANNWDRVISYMKEYPDNLLIQVCPSILKKSHSQSKLSKKRRKKIEKQNPTSVNTDVCDWTNFDFSIFFPLFFSLTALTGTDFSSVYPVLSVLSVCPVCLSCLSISVWNNSIEFSVNIIDRYIFIQYDTHFNIIYNFQIFWSRICFIIILLLLTIYWILFYIVSIISIIFSRIYININITDIPTWYISLSTLFFSYLGFTALGNWS